MSATRAARPAELLPLTPVVFHTLLTLAEGEGHGYAIAREVEKQTEGRVRMGPGTLYGSLQRMCSLGLIEPIQPRKDPSAHGQRRRYYQITRFGKRVLREETQRLAEVVNLARTRVAPDEA